MSDDFLQEWRDTLNQVGQEIDAGADDMRQEDSDNPEADNEQQPADEQPEE